MQFAVGNSMDNGPPFVRERSLISLVFSRKLHGPGEIPQNPYNKNHAIVKKSMKIRFLPLSKHVARRD